MVPPNSSSPTQSQKNISPTGKKPVGPMSRSSLLLPESGRQRSGFMFTEQLAYPTVVVCSSTAIPCQQATEAYTSLDTLTALHYGC
jgi:hypothetical protein